VYIVQGSVAISLDTSTDGIEETIAMAQAEIVGERTPLEPASGLSVATKTSRTPNSNGAAGTSDKPGNNTSTDGATSTYTDPPAYFDDALKDAERMLKYAAEMGICIDDETREHVLQARAASSGGWDKQTSANLLAALTALAVRLRPVTAASLKACVNSTRQTVRSYWGVAACLAIVIVPFSLASFVSSAVSNAIRADIVTANDLAVKLRTQLGVPSPPTLPAAPAVNTAVKPAHSLPPGLSQEDVITELQQYASTIRAIDARARQLNVLVLHAERDPFASYRNDSEKLHNKFQLPLGLPNLAEAAEERTQVYQDVRYFAQGLLDDVSFFYGAISTCLLPVLYALLGTCAYLLRSFEQQMALRTFTPSVANSARFLIAAIGGAVVGLFNNFTVTEEVSIPPLAIAFLVGYAVDVFFAFLEGLLQAFTKGGSSSPAPVPASAAKA
jgi:hypothetical protein